MWGGVERVKAFECSMTWPPMRRVATTNTTNRAATKATDPRMARCQAPWWGDDGPALRSAPTRIRICDRRAGDAGTISSYAELMSARNVIAAPPESPDLDADA